MGNTNPTSRAAARHPGVPPALCALTLSTLQLPSSTVEKRHSPGSLGAWLPTLTPSTHLRQTGPAAEPVSYKPDGDQARCQQTARVPF